LRRRKHRGRVVHRRHRAGNRRSRSGDPDDIGGVVTTHRAEAGVWVIARTGSADPFAGSSSPTIAGAICCPIFRTPPAVWSRLRHRGLTEGAERSILI
jgi:hypothetical protein